MIAITPASQSANASVVHVGRLERVGDAEGPRGAIRAPSTCLSDVTVRGAPVDMRSAAIGLVGDASTFGNRRAVVSTADGTGTTRQAGRAALSTSNATVPPSARVHMSCLTA